MEILETLEILETIEKDIEWMLLECLYGDNFQELKLALVEAGKIPVGITSNRYTAMLLTVYRGNINESTLIYYPLLP